MLSQKFSKFTYYLKFLIMQLFRLLNANFILYNLKKKHCWAYYILFFLFHSKAATKPTKPTVNVGCTTIKEDCAYDTN